MRTHLRRAAVAIGELQGFAGVACLTAGAYLLYGLAVALLVVGGFLTLAAALRAVRGSR